MPHTLQHHSNPTFRSSWLDSSPGLRVTTARVSRAQRDTCRKVSMSALVPTGWRPTVASGGPGVQIADQRVHAALVAQIRARFASG